MTDRGPFAGRARAWLVSILAIAGFSIWVSGHAQEPAPYYQGKTIAVHIVYAALLPPGTPEAQTVKISPSPVRATERTAQTAQFWLVMNLSSHSVESMIILTMLRGLSHLSLVGSLFID